MRTIIAALLAAVIMFLWEFVAHMLLPIGTMGVHQAPNEDVVLQAVASAIPQPGIYIVPGIDPSKMNDEAALKALSEKTKTNPLAFVVVGGVGQDTTQFGPNLIKQFLSDYFAALIAAAVLGAAAMGFGTRVLGMLGFGLFGWLANIVPLWNWYRFPADYLYGNLIEQGVGWLLAGFGLAWWLGRRSRR
jgi:hypothetical protein